MSRRFVLGGAVVLVAMVLAAVALLVVIGRDDNGADSPDLDAEAATVLAATACRRLERFGRLIDANASTQQVLEELDDARTAADEATRRDPRWVRLASGVQAVNAGLRANDPVATRTGIDLARSVCRERARSNGRIGFAP